MDDGLFGRWTTDQIGWTAFWQMDDGPNRLDGLFGRWTTNLIGWMGFLADG